MAIVANSSGGLPLPGGGNMAALVGGHGSDDSLEFNSILFI